MRRIATVLLALAIVGAFATTAVAQAQLQYNVVVTGDVVKGSARDHFLTFDEPLRIPEATLPAGTYVFTILGSSAVQVSTADRSQQLAMFFTTPVTRPDAPRAYEITLLRQPASGQGRITQWFLPYQTVGLEFQYGTEEVRGER